MVLFVVKTYKKNGLMQKDQGQCLIDKINIELAKEGTEKVRKMKLREKADDGISPNVAGGAA